VKVRDRLPDLMSLELQLEALPKGVALSGPARERIRTEVIAYACQGRPVRTSWPERLGQAVASAFAPRTVMRPLGAALSVLAALVLAGGTTVSAAMESLPGDSLYPVKTAYESGCLLLATTGDGRAQCHLWMASTRVLEMDRAAQEGRFDSAQKSAESLGENLGQALSVAAETKEPERVREQAAAVQTSLGELYRKAPELRDIVAVPFSGQALATQGAASDTTHIPNSGTTVEEQFPVQQAVSADETPVVAAAPPLPSGSTALKDKGQTNPQPVSGKEEPVSRPLPVPVDSDGVPLKNEVGPAVAPLPTRSDSTTSSGDQDKADTAVQGPAIGPSKTEGPGAFDSPVAPKEPTSPAAPATTPDQKPSIVVQGWGAAPLAGGPR